MLICLLTAVSLLSAPTYAAHLLLSMLPSAENMINVWARQQQQQQQQRKRLKNTPVLNIQAIKAGNKRHRLCECEGKEKTDWCINLKLHWSTMSAPTGNILLLFHAPSICLALCVSILYYNDCSLRIVEIDFALTPYSSPFYIPPTSLSINCKHEL